MSTTSPQDPPVQLVIDFSERIYSFMVLVLIIVLAMIPPYVIVNWKKVFEMLGGKVKKLK